MSGPRARLLVSGDLHLGRYPARVPPGDPALLVEAVVRSLVDQAIERSVDAVVLAGDLADETNKYFEAYGILERTLHRLVDAGVPVYAVAGDHDHDVLGTVSDAVGAGVRVLGRGQTWESVPLRRGGHERVRFVGWSFAGPHVHTSPLDTWPGADPDVPTVGVLHGDLGAAASAGAPVSLDALRATGVDAWVVGGAHTSRVEPGEPLVLCPGSPQPLGPDERGPHHAWIVEVGDGPATAEPIPLATVRYDAIGVDLEGAADGTEIRERVAAELRGYASAIRGASPAVRRAVVRLTLKGRTPAYRAVGDVVAELEAAGETTADGLTVTVDRIADRARPALDLARLAEGSGPVATLAGLAQRLEAGVPSEGDLGLIRRGVEALQQARRARVFEPLARNGRLEPDLQAEAVLRLRRQTYRLLDEALDQKPSDHAADAPSSAASRARPVDAEAPAASGGDTSPTADASDTAPTASGSGAASATSGGASDADPEGDPTVAASARSTDAGAPAASGDGTAPPAREGETSPAARGDDPDGAAATAVEAGPASARSAGAPDS